MSPKERFAVLFDPETLEALRGNEERLGIPIGEQVRRAVRAYLADFSKQVTEELKRGAKGTATKRASRTKKT